MIDKIYWPVITRLKTIPEIKTFDLWNNQIGNEGKELGFLRPACFISFPQINPIQYADNKQRIEGILTIRLVYESYEGFENDILKKGAGISALINSIQRKMAKGFADDATATFRRMGMRMPDTSNNIFIFEIDYSYSITDFIGSIDEDLIDRRLSTLTFNGNVSIKPNL